MFLSERVIRNRKMFPTYPFGQKSIEPEKKYTFMTLHTFHIICNKLTNRNLVHNVNIIKPIIIEP